MAIHRQLLPLMESDPEKFPRLTMCHRTRRVDNQLILAYGTERHPITPTEGREYLERLLRGHTGRHDEVD